MIPRKPKTSLLIILVGAYFTAYMVSHLTNHGLGLIHTSQNLFHGNSNTTEPDLVVTLDNLLTDKFSSEGYKNLNTLPTLVNKNVISKTIKKQKTKKQPKATMKSKVKQQPRTFVKSTIKQRASIVTTVAMNERPKHPTTAITTKQQPKIKPKVKKQQATNTTATTIKQRPKKPAITKQQQTKSKTKQQSRTPIKPTTKQHPKCKPSRSVVFLKTHKTGSSTVLNILQRYSERHKLTMALPCVNKKQHSFHYPMRFKKDAVFEYEEGRRYNLLTNHARFNKKSMLEVMEDPQNTKFVTILREPIYQLESVMSYYRYDLVLNFTTTNTIKELFHRIQHNRSDLVRMLKKSRSYVIKGLAKNPIAFDLAFDNYREHPRDVSRILESVKKDLTFVMISDYMIESLVLLADELCWELEDVVYFTLNKRPNKFRATDAELEAKRAQIRTWSKIDSALFKHFNQTLWKRAERMGPQFQKDVEKLKAMNKDLEEKCIDRGTHYDKTQPWFPILGYKIKDTAKNESYYDLCLQMARSEIDYNNRLGEIWSRNNWKIPIKQPAKTDH